MKQTEHANYDRRFAELMQQKVTVLEEKVVVIEKELMQEKKRTGIFLWCFFIVILFYVFTYFFPKILGVF